MDQSSILGELSNAVRTALAGAGGLASRAEHALSSANQSLNQKMDQWLTPSSLAASQSRQPPLQQQPHTVVGYRADATGKFGGSDGLETLPTKFDANELYAHARAMTLGAPYGVPQLSAQQLAALALKEGQSNFGTNYAPLTQQAFDSGAPVTYYDPNNSHSKQIYNSLTASGLPSAAAGFASKLYEKQQVASRLGVPLLEAWNGVGRSHSTGLSGSDYAKSYNQFVSAAQHPKNAALLSLIQAGISAGRMRR